MTPNELYALPTVVREPWHRVSDETVFDVFGVHDLDHEAAAKADDDRVAFETKLSCTLDWGERSAAVRTVSLDGTPFAYRCTAGRGERDMDDFVVTDVTLMRDAIGHLAHFAKSTEFTSSDPDVADPNLSGFYGTRIVVVDGRVRMVRDDQVSKSGKLLFDEERWDASFDVLVRPAFSAAKDDAKLGLGHAGIRSAAARAVVAGFPIEARAVVIDRMSQGEWFAGAFATEDGTFLVSVPASGSLGYLAWASSLDCRRIGGPDGLDRLMAGLVDTPETGMSAP